MKRVGALACLAVTLATIATAATAQGQIASDLPISPAIPTPLPTPAPEPTPEPIVTVRMLQAPDELDAPRLRELADELGVSNAAGVILLLPGGATIADGEDAEAALDELEAATSARSLTVVPQDGTSNGDASKALEARGAGVEPVTAGCAADCVLRKLGLEGAQLALLDELDGSAASPADVLSMPEGDDGGGAFMTLLLVGVSLAALASIVTVLVARRRPTTGGALGVTSAARYGGERRQPSPEPPPGPGPVGGSSPAPPQPPHVPPPRRNGRGQPAVVASVLEPEGYVELDGCLRRVRWAAEGVPAPAPGEWVEIEGRQGRLWAFPRQSKTRPVVGANRTETES